MDGERRSSAKLFLRVGVITVDTVSGFPLSNFSGLLGAFTTLLVDVSGRVSAEVG